MQRMNRKKSRILFFSGVASTTLISLMILWTFYLDSEVLALLLAAPWAFSLEGTRAAYDNYKMLDREQKNE
jgi:hypothetical protein